MWQPCLELTGGLGLCHQLLPLRRPPTHLRLYLVLQLNVLALLNRYYGCTGYTAGRISGLFISGIWFRLLDIRLDIRIEKLS